MRKPIIRKLLVMFILAATVSWAATPDYLYVAATNVRMRESATTSGKLLATLPIGTWAKIVETSEKTETLLGKNAHWYKVKTDNQQQGWVFGGLTRPTTQENRFDVALQIISAPAEGKNKTTDDLLQTLDFAATVKELASHSAEKAELELAFLVILDRVYSSLALNEKGADSKHRAIKDYNDICYFHEPAGQHFVKPEALWELAEKYADIGEVAEKIAWAAANQTMHGETEGDPDMMIYSYEMSHARYIESFPEGKHIAKALENGSSILDYVGENLAYYDNDESKEQLKQKIAWFTDLAALTPESEARKKIFASIKKLADRLSH